MPEGVIALLQTLAGGALLYIVQGIFGLKNKNVDENYKIRQDQRRDIDELKKQVAALLAEQTTMRKELDTWKEKYWTVVGEDNKLALQYQSLREEHEELKKDHEALKVKNKALEDEVVSLQKQITANKLSS